MQVFFLKELKKCLFLARVSLDVDFEKSVPKFYLLGLGRVFVILRLGELNKHFVVLFGKGSDAPTLKFVDKVQVVVRNGSLY